MQIIGLTGSIATGKTTVADMCRRLRLPVHDADGCVHRLLGPGGAAVSLVAAEFGLQPDAAGAIDRAALGKKVFQDPPARRRLEAILHPLVSADRDSFLARYRRRRARFVVLDVPLLFETGGDAFCDFVICVWAPLRVQKKRALSRPAMNAEKLAGIMRAQMPQGTKKRLADLALPSALGYAETNRRLRRWLARLRRPENSEDRQA